MCGQKAEYRQYDKLLAIVSYSSARRLDEDEMRWLFDAMYDVMQGGVCRVLCRPVRRIVAYIENGGGPVICLRICVELSRAWVYDFSPSQQNSQGL